MTPGHHAARGGAACCAALCVLGALQGCGGSSPAALSASSATRLHGEVQSIRSAAAKHDARMAHTAVGVLRRDIGRLAASGQLNRSDARVLLVEAGQLDGRVSTEVKPVAPPPATSQPSAVSPSTPSVGVQDGDGSGNGNGKGKGKGKGEGKGNGKREGKGGEHGGD